MNTDASIDVMKFLFRLSETLDLAFPALVKHQMRTSYIALKIGEEARLALADLEQIFLAALLHDVGALSPDDKVSIRTAKYTANLETHCIYGERALSRVPILVQPARIVRHHHTPWSAWGSSIGDGLPFKSQILLIADEIERAIKPEKYILHQDDDITSHIRALSGTVICPAVVELFEPLAAREDFWLSMMSPVLPENMLLNSPFTYLTMTQPSFFILAELVSAVVDFRSHFTVTHSNGVAAATSAIASRMGLPEAEIDLLRTAAKLHDVGKMAVPNSILNKPGNLTKDEFAVVRNHTFYTYQVLRQSGFEKRVCEWAGFHHERLNGAGYPFHVGAREISAGSRIVAVADTFTALTEDRPYRKGMQKNEVLTILQDMSTAERLDRHVVEVMKHHYDEILTMTRQDQLKAQQTYEADFSSV